MCSESAIYPDCCCERKVGSTRVQDGGGKTSLKPIIHFQTWRVGILVFLLGNCLNFISFGYAAQSLLAVLGSIQFLSNRAFSYVVLNKMVTVKVLVAAKPLKLLVSLLTKRPWIELEFILIIRIFITILVITNNY